MRTWFLCIYPKYDNGLRGFHVHIGVAGWRWWGWSITRAGIKSLGRYVVLGGVR